MARDISETQIGLPWDVVEECNGIAFDIGGSVMKCAYIHKDDWIENKSDRKQKVCPIRFLNCPKEQIDKSISNLKDLVLIKRLSDEDKPVVYMTGTGGLQLIERIKELFHVNTEVFAEMDMFMDCHRYLLTHLSSDEVVHARDQTAIQHAEEFNRGMAQMLSKMKEQTTMDMKSAADNLPKLHSVLDPSLKFNMDEVFPCMVVMCGSAGGCMVVNKDGSFRPVEMLMRRVGKMFYGLGCLLTGAKSYTELMELAEKGTDKTVHQYMSDMREGVAKQEDESFYSSTADASDFPVYLFGKAIHKTTNDFKPEDLARALAFTMATDLVEIVHLQLNRVSQPIKHVFFGGNHVNHQLMRHLITLEWYKRDMNLKTYGVNGTELVEIHFLRHGAHYGALGGLLSQRLKSTKQEDTSAAK